MQQYEQELQRQQHEAEASLQAQQAAVHPYMISAVHCLSNPLLSNPLSNAL